MSNTLQPCTNSIQPEVKDVPNFISLRLTDFIQSDPEAKIKDVLNCTPKVLDLCDSGVYVIIGKVGSGKTVLIDDLIQRFQKSFQNTDVKILYNNLVEKEQFCNYNEITFYKNSPDEIEKFMEYESDKPKLYVIPIINSGELKRYDKLIMHARHINARIIIELQISLLMSPLLRCNTNYVITFKPAGKNELKKIYNIYRDFTDINWSEEQFENQIQALEKYQTLWFGNQDPTLYTYKTVLDKPQCSWCNKFTQGGSLCEKCKTGKDNRRESKKRKREEKVPNQNIQLLLKDMAIITCDEKDMVLEKLVALPNSGTKVRQTTSVKMDLISIPPELVNIFHMCLWDDAYSECSYKYVYVTQRGLNRMYDTIPNVELIMTPDFAKVKKMAIMFNSSTLSKIIDITPQLPWFSENLPFFSCAQPFLSVRFLFYSDEPISNPQIHLRVTGDTYHISIHDQLIKKHSDFVVYLATNERIVYADPTL